MFMVYFFNSQTDEDIIALCIRKPFRLQRTTEICMNNLTYYDINLTKINKNLFIQQSLK